MTEVVTADSNQGDLVEYTAAELGVSQERARHIVSIHHPNILGVGIEEVQVPEPTVEQGE